MKKIFLLVMMTVLFLPEALAQYRVSGNCGEDVKWTFDGYTLVITNVSKKPQKVAMDDYGLENLIAPWIKKKLDVKKVEIGNGITKIGSCAFARCTNLQEVIFQGTDLREIGWGAFMDCYRLRNISMPIQLSHIETIAFANCNSLASVKIPDNCRVDNQAFVSCDNLKSIELGATSIIGHHVFASEINQGNRVRHTLYNGEIVRLPAYINPDNGHEFGLGRSSVEKCVKGRIQDTYYDYMTSDVDSLIPTSMFSRNDTYALIIGNQSYRFASDVPYAIHDARVFGDYCKMTLGIPAGNIHIVENATKQMILEEEFEDWIKNIGNREDKKLIVYYAGHGVPDKKKAYILPTDVRGTNPKRGIALEDFYTMLGELNFRQTSVFLDACFSGINRTNEGVTEGLRAAEEDVENSALGDGSIVVFSATTGNETAQGYPEQGHGLFTYYLLKTLQDTGGDLNYGTLSDNITSNVSLQADNMKIRKKQTPTTNASDKIINVWRRLRF